MYVINVIKHTHTRRGKVEERGKKMELIVKIRIQILTEKSKKKNKLATWKSDGKSN